jgi:hypothetical protein
VKRAIWPVPLCGSPSTPREASSGKALPVGPEGEGASSEGSVPPKGRGQVGKGGPEERVHLRVGRSDSDTVKKEEENRERVRRLPGARLPAAGFTPRSEDPG